MEDSTRSVTDGREKISHVRVGYANLAPFTHVKTENGQEILDGFMPAIIRAVTQWMNLNVTWVREPENKYGSWNGTHFDGMVGMLDRNEADFLVNPIIPQIEVFRICEFLNPIIYEAFTMVSGKEIREGGLFLYFSVLSPMVWAWIGITLIAIAFVSSIIFLRISDGAFPCLLALLDYVWVYVTYMLRQEANTKWMLRQKKNMLSVFLSYMMVSWMIGIAFLIMATFQSLLVSKLTIVKQYPVVDSLQEFIKKTSVIGKTPKEIELQLALKDSGIPVYDKAWEKLEPEQETAATVFSDESFKKVEDGKYCLFHGHLIFRTILGDYFKRKGRCNLHLSNNMFFPFALVIPVKRTLPRKFRDKLNFGITRLVEADISGKWFKTIYEIANFCTSYSDAQLKPLSLNNIYGVLAIWGAGMLSATISVIAENIYFNYSKNKRPFKRRRL